MSKSQVQIVIGLDEYNDLQICRDKYTEAMQDVVKHFYKLHRAWEIKLEEKGLTAQFRNIPEYSLLVEKINPIKHRRGIFSGFDKDGNLQIGYKRDEELN